MASVDEIFRLEKELSEIAKSILQAEATLSRQPQIIGVIKAKIQAQELALKVAQSNLTHMRKVADHVVLEEWVEVTRIVEASNDLLQEARQELVKVNKEKEKVLKLLEDMRLAQSVRESNLNHYGQVQQFSKRFATK